MNYSLHYLPYPAGEFSSVDCTIYLRCETEKGPFYFPFFSTYASMWNYGPRDTDLDINCLADIMDDYHEDSFFADFFDSISEMAPVDDETLHRLLSYYEDDLPKAFFHRMKPLTSIEYAVHHMNESNMEKNSQYLLSPNGVSQLVPRIRSEINCLPAPIYLSSLNMFKTKPEILLD